MSFNFGPPSTGGTAAPTTFGFGGNSPAKPAAFSFGTGNTNTQASPAKPGAFTFGAGTTTPTATTPSFTFGASSTTNTTTTTPSFSFGGSTPGKQQQTTTFSFGQQPAAGNGFSIPQGVSTVFVR